MQIPQCLLCLFPSPWLGTAALSLALLRALPLRMHGPEVPGSVTHIRAHADLFPRSILALSMPLATKVTCVW